MFVNEKWANPLCGKDFGPLAICIHYHAGSLQGIPYIRVVNTFHSPLPTIYLFSLFDFCSSMISTSIVVDSLDFMTFLSWLATTLVQSFSFFSCSIISPDLVRFFPGGQFSAGLPILLSFFLFCMFWRTNSLWENLKVLDSTSDANFMKNRIHWSHSHSNTHISPPYEYCISHPKILKLW